MKPITSWPVVAGLVVIALGCNGGSAGAGGRAKRAPAERGEVGPGGGAGGTSDGGGTDGAAAGTGGTTSAAGTGGSLAGTGGGGDGGGAAAGGSGGDSGAQGAPEAARARSIGPARLTVRRARIMPFGDSITDGYNGDTPGGYRVRAVPARARAGKNITFVGSGSNGPNTVGGVAFPHNHEGHSGWTIAPAGGRSGISTLVSTVMPQYKPDIVLLMIGTNDAIDNYDMPNAPERLGALIDSIYAQLPNVFIVVAAPSVARGDASKGTTPRSARASRPTTTPFRRW